ncbi:MAG: hypothetical protein AAGF26_09150 [Cyanobacteria bacterium P01_G01_bin.49]
MWLTTFPVSAVTRSNFYLPDEDFCAVYQGSINSEHQFILSVKQENKLTIQANNDLKVAVIRQGKIITPYQIQASKTPMISQWFYYTKLQQKHIISIKGHTSQAKIRLCLIK